MRIMIAMLLNNRLIFLSDLRKARVMEKFTFFAAKDGYLP